MRIRISFRALWATGAFTLICIVGAFFFHLRSSISPDLATLSRFEPGIDFSKNWSETFAFFQTYYSYDSEASAALLSELRNKHWALDQKGSLCRGQLGGYEVLFHSDGRPGPLDYGVYNQVGSNTVLVIKVVKKGPIDMILWPSKYP